MLYIGIVHRVCYPGYDSFSGFFSRDLYSFPFFCPRATHADIHADILPVPRAGPAALTFTRSFSTTLLYALRACAHVTRPKSVERRIRRDTEESSLESATHQRDGTRTRRSTAPRPTVWHSTVTQPQRSQSRSSSTGSRRPSWRCSRDHEGAERGQCPDIGPPRLPPERGQCPAYPSPTTPHRYDITAWYPRH